MLSQHSDTIYSVAYFRQTRNWAFISMFIWEWKLNLGSGDLSIEPLLWRHSCPIFMPVSTTVFFTLPFSSLSFYSTNFIIIFINPLLIYRQLFTIQSILLLWLDFRRLILREKFSSSGNSWFFVLILIFQYQIFEFSL